MFTAMRRASLTVAERAKDQQSRLSYTRLAEALETEQTNSSHSRTWRRSRTSLFIYPKLDRQSRGHRPRSLSRRGDVLEKKLGLWRASRNGID